jgi:predicted aspartyl protease
LAVSPSLISPRFPYLPLHLELDGRHVDVEALLDTGFDGDVALPLALLADGQPPADYVRWTLADGSTVLAPVYDGIVQIGPFSPYPVLITVVGDEPIVGRGVTDNFLITLDHGRQVIVEL